MILPEEISKENLTVESNITSKLKTKRRFLAQKALTDWSLICTFHCYPKIFQYENKLAKLMWLILFIIFTGFTGYLSIKNLVDYFDYEVVSKTQIINEVPFLFPAITICDSNPFSSKQGEEFLESIWKRYYTDAQMFVLKDSAYEFAKFSLASSIYNQSFKKSLGLSQNKFHHCKFNSLNCNVSSDFNWYFSFYYGNCYQFNTYSSIPLKSSYFEGKAFGFSIELSDLIYENTRFPFSESKGFKIYIHNQSVNEPGIFDEPISIELGKETNIAIKRKSYYDYPKPYSKCENLDSHPSSLLNKIIKSGNIYRQNDCLKLCLQQDIINLCKCYFVGLQSYEENIKPCSSEIDYICFRKLLSNYDENNKEKRENCSKFCPLECESIEYDFEVSSLENPSEEFYNALLKNRNPNLINGTFETNRKHFLNLNIFYSALKYVQIIQTPKTTLIDLISNLGGSIGIFLGFSIFSLLEIIEILVQMILIFFLNKKIN